MAQATSRWTAARWRSRRGNLIEVAWALASRLHLLPPWAFRWSASADCLRGGGRPPVAGAPRPSRKDARHTKSPKVRSAPRGHGVPAHPSSADCPSATRREHAAGLHVSWPGAELFQFEKSPGLRGRRQVDPELKRCIPACAASISQSAGQDDAVWAAARDAHRRGGGRKIEIELAGNIADICPVGALTNRASGHARGASQHGSLPHCSKGCNVVLGYHPRNEIPVRDRPN
jgi:hypothetical protein